MTKSLRNSFVALSLGICFACHMQGEELRVEVVSPLLPDTTCTYAASNSQYSKGYYDPTVDGGQGYALALLVRNNMQQDSQDDVVPLGEIKSINRTSHDVRITGFDACWYTVSADGASGLKTDSHGFVDCATLPEQSGKLPASGHVDEGYGLSVVQTTVLTIDALRSLFGEGFAPTNIPPLGRIAVYNDPSVNPTVANGNQAISLRAGYAFTTEDPGNLAGRSVFWGAKYPDTRDTTVVVQMRANLTLQTGEQFYGSWFTFPITVCTGCLQDYCGPLVEEVCAKGPCADGTQCLSSGLCANPTLTCSPTTLYSGARPDFYGQTGVNTCYPAQGLSTVTPMTCQPVGCKASN